MKAARFNSHMLHEIVKKSKFTTGMVITFQVMAFARMSPGHPDPVRTFPQSSKGKFGAHAPGARDPDNPDIRRIFHPAHTRQVRCTITAPVA
jgi:hypothetical protein